MVSTTAVRREPKMLDFLPKAGFIWQWADRSPLPPQMLRSKHQERYLVKHLDQVVPDVGKRLTKKLLVDEMASTFRRFTWAAQEDGTRIEKADLLQWLKYRVCETFWGHEIPRMVWVEFIYRFVEARLKYNNHILQLDPKKKHKGKDISVLAYRVQEFIDETEEMWEREGALIEMQFNPEEQMDQEFTWGDWMPEDCETWREWAERNGDEKPEKQDDDDAHWHRSFLEQLQDMPVDGADEDDLS
ncbi:hypothetical protein QBC37DRAFT_379517 [Rhypophila decipiens]|uniref:Uncharacterized protein n=1 Tax=Rhypophila decipiens TaxID=261697 RepID=A0AAN6Y286_9PEZI|nr:hypothetical protein QBC37DRAFT_379517 [Rhypophila decipiens]